MSSVTFASMNCQGHGDAKKRRDVFQYLRSKAFSVYLLQDTHFNPKLENYILAEWGYKGFFASHNSSSRGVAVLFNNNFEFSVEKVKKDLNGNYIFVAAKILDKRVLIVSIYGPNKDNPEFYLALERKIREIGIENVIIGGDWNLVLNFTLDYYNYKHKNNIKAQEQIDTMMTNLDLVDIWRELNPEVQRFTWRRQRPFQQSRLDFFLMSDSFSSYVVDADISSGYRTDHSLVILSLCSENDKKRCNLWKFNAQHLRDQEYLTMINEHIYDVISEYAALVYDRNNLSNIPLSEIEMVISDQTFLDTLLMKIRARTIMYGSNKKTKNLERKRIRE